MSRTTLPLILTTPSRSWKRPRRGRGRLTAAIIITALATSIALASILDPGPSIVHESAGGLSNNTGQASTTCCGGNPDMDRLRNEQ